MVKNDQCKAPLLSEELEMGFFLRGESSCTKASEKEKIHNSHWFPCVILLHEKFLQFYWLSAVVFQLNLKYLHVKITNHLQVVV